MEDKSKGPEPTGKVPPPHPPEIEGEARSSANPSASEGAFQESFYSSRIRGREFKPQHPDADTFDPDTLIPVPSYVSESELYGNYKQFVERAVDVFGDEIKASKWLSLPNVDLGGATPLEVAQPSAYKSEKVEMILTRIEHGIYS